jgi:hypothetical protein
LPDPVVARFVRAVARVCVRQVLAEMQGEASEALS